MIELRRLVALGCLFALAWLGGASAATAGNPVAAIVDPRVFDDTANGQVGQFIVVLRPSADLLTRGLRMHGVRPPRARGHARRR